MTSLSTNPALKDAQEMKDILKNIIEQSEKLCALSTTVPSIQNAVLNGTKDISEQSIDLLYIIADYMGTTK